MKNRTELQRLAGFTLIELMVTIVIGSILVSIAVPTYLSQGPQVEAHRRQNGRCSIWPRARNACSQRRMPTAARLRLLGTAPRRIDFPSSSAAATTRCPLSRRRDAAGLHAGGHAGRRAGAGPGHGLRVIHARPDRQPVRSGFHQRRRDRELLAIVLSCSGGRGLSIAARRGNLETHCARLRLAVVGERAHSPPVLAAPGTSRQRSGGKPSAIPVHSAAEQRRAQPAPDKPAQFDPKPGHGIGSGVQTRSGATTWYSTGNKNHVEYEAALGADGTLTGTLHLGSMPVPFTGDARIDQLGKPASACRTQIMPPNIAPTPAHDRRDCIGHRRQSLAALVQQSDLERKRRERCEAAQDSRDQKEARIRRQVGAQGEVLRKNTDQQGPQHVDEERANGGISCRSSAWRAMLTPWRAAAPNPPPTKTSRNPIERPSFTVYPRGRPVRRRNGSRRGAAKRPRNRSYQPLRAVIGKLHSPSFAQTRHESWRRGWDSNPRYGHPYT